MSLITIMNGIPLYTTKEEALVWALANGVIGYHTHKHNNQKGYMGGSTHAQAINRENLTTSPTTPTQLPPQQTIVNPMSTRPQPTQQRVEPTTTNEVIRRISRGRSGGRY